MTEFETKFFLKLPKFIRNYIFEIYIKLRLYTSMYIKVFSFLLWGNKCNSFCHPVCWGAQTSSFRNFYCFWVIIFDNKNHCFVIFLSKNWCASNVYKHPKCKVSMKLVKNDCVRWNWLNRYTKNSGLKNTYFMYL